MAASKACVDGLVAHQALTAVQLARHGLRGKLTAFEGPDGFLAGVARKYDEAVLLAPVTRFRILDVYTKQYNAVKCASVGGRLGAAAQASAHRLERGRADNAAPVRA